MFARWWLNTESHMAHLRGGLVHRVHLHGNRILHTSKPILTPVYHYIQETMSYHYAGYVAMGIDSQMLFIRPMDGWEGEWPPTNRVIYPKQSLLEWFGVRSSDSLIQKKAAHVSRLRECCGFDYSPLSITYFTRSPTRLL